MNYRIIKILMLIYTMFSHKLPGKGREYLGRFTGWLFYKAVKSRREVAQRNLRKSFPSMKPKEVDQIIGDVFRNLGFTLVEFFQTKKLTGGGYKKYIEIENEDYLQEAFNRGQGVIIYSAHFGNWEWLLSIIAAMGYPLTVIARRQNEIVNKIYEDIRETTGSRIIYRGEGSFQKSLDSLKQGGCVYLVGDQEALTKGWKVQFLGRPASAFNGVVKLAGMSGAAVVPTFLIRTGPERHRLVFKEPVYVADDATEEEQREILQELTDIYNDIITEHKSQWLWIHRRWKTYS